MFDQVDRSVMLRGIIANDIADENAGIDRDQDCERRYRSATASPTAFFISSMETGGPSYLTMPRSLRMSPVRGFRTSSPAWFSTKSTFDPALSRSLRRISIGIVICPLDVTVANAIFLT